MKKKEIISNKYYHNINLIEKLPKMIMITLLLLIAIIPIKLLQKTKKQS